MRLESRWLVRAGLAAATVAAGLPFQNIESGQRAVGVLFGDAVDCTDGVKSTNPAYPFAAIVVPSAGISITTDGQSVLSDFEEIRLGAAALLYKEGVAPFIIIPNGEGASVEIEYLRGAYQALSEDNQPIPDRAILVGDRVINTATEMAEAAKIAKKYGLQPLIVNTNKFHEDRATLLLCAQGVPSSSVAAEKVIVKYSPKRVGEFKELYDSQTMAVRKAKEYGEIAELIVDPGGFVPTVIREIFPP